MPPHIGNVFGHFYRCNMCFELLCCWNCQCHTCQNGQPSIKGCFQWVIGSQIDTDQKEKKEVQHDKIFWIHNKHIDMLFNSVQTFIAYPANRKCIPSIIFQLSFQAWKVVVLGTKLLTVPPMLWTQRNKITENWIRHANVYTSVLRTPKYRWQGLMEIWSWCTDKISKVSPKSV